MFDRMWSKVPGLVNTLDNEGEMDLMLANTEESLRFRVYSIHLEHKSVFDPLICYN